MKCAYTVLLAAVMFSACAHKKHSKLVPPPPPPPPAGTPSAGTTPVKPGYVETGLASWYGHPYHGRPAANGEIYDMETMVAAHRTLPFDTWVRVYDLDTGKTVEVRIIDRGPFVDGRIIDLSHAAAEAIAMIGPGTARVRMEDAGYYRPHRLPDETCAAWRWRLLRFRRSPARRLETPPGPRPDPRRSDTAGPAPDRCS